MFAQESTDPTLMKLLKEGMKKYPENVRYYDALTNLYGLSGDHKSGLHFAEKGLEKFPDNPELLYAKAGHLHMLPKNPDLKQSVATYKLFLSIAPPDHRQVPEAYYSIASLCFDKGSGKSTVKSKMEMEHYYNLGKESEANMLPCYLPYESGNKLGVEDLLRIAQAEESTSPSLPINIDSFKMSNDPQPNLSNILEKKKYLSCPVRKRLILEHRNNFSSFAKHKDLLDLSLTFTIPPKLIQKTPKQMSQVKSITLKKMNPTTDTIFQDRKIDFTIVEDPLFDSVPNVVHLVVEDGNGDLSRLYLYNTQRHKENEDNLSFGSKLTLLNPYLRIGGMDETNGIRNDEPGCVIFLGKVVDMCRFCGEENAPHKCSKCKRAGYCSRECQKFDWSMMKHKLICGEQ